jgi:hypothetical protein
MLLADLGADVIRVDRRQGSEDRYTGPVTEGGEGGAYLSLNRNKRSLTLDTSKPDSAEIIRRLAKTADVVVANLPIAVLKKMGLDYDALRASSPTLSWRASRLSDPTDRTHTVWASIPLRRRCRLFDKYSQLLGMSLDLYHEYRGTPRPRTEVEGSGVQ